MKTKALMIASALFMAACGLVGSFLPQELLLHLQVEPVGALPVLIQLLGAALLALAMINWIAKDNLVGGIYSRPIALGNFLHFTVGALALGKAVAGGVTTVEAIVATVVYAAFALAFGAVLFGSPVRPARGR